MNTARTSHPRVLVVEDDPGAALEVASALEDYGFDVECVPNGLQGLLRAMHAEFDAVVLDRMLPDLDGLSILATLRNIGKQTPVLILSALDAVDERVRGLRAGGDDYLVKPFDGLELTARLNALLRRRQAAANGVSDAQTLCVGELTLERATRTVRRAGELIELKPREYSLLEFLMCHAGEVVTRTMLLESVWNYHFNTQTNVIDMHISNLRRKLSLNGRLSAMIVTVRNSGYIIHVSV
ncbi:response regulator transcription factor [Paraburkholderia sp. Ac-20340]|uniref:response regulator transcription factor n=1 Tax=Paraburkholderia sp. Ac-20340 TaxID=2703888 RepID=UPI00197F6812|nr:response regulator transcription factor [Paraburkholderia sp. Ac-20340]MBN3854921.1 response regulator transcription factor [Paraburkholderia sp. Ac-20340]